MDVAETLRQNYLKQFPEVMKNLQLIIEFSDCIIQGKDLLDYDIVIDEDLQRVQQTALAEASKREGLPNAGLVEGVQVSPRKTALKEDGIIKENQYESKKPLNTISEERVQNVKSYIKNNAANFYVLRNTHNTLDKIKQVQRKQTQPCAQRMKTPKEQFNFLQDSNALMTSAANFYQREREITR